MSDLDLPLPSEGGAQGGEKRGEHNGKDVAASTPAKASADAQGEGQLGSLRADHIHAQHARAHVEFSQRNDSLKNGLCFLA